MDIKEKNKQIKVKYILSNINKALAFEWIAQELDRSKYDLSFILLNPDDSALEQYLLTHAVGVERITYNGKKDLPAAIYKIYHILRSENIQVVHCHMFDACIAGLTAARLTSVKKRVYTRHHATFHQQYFPRAVWYDKFISYMATDIVAISENVRETLIGEGINPEKIHLIHHGFKLDGFEKVDDNQIAVLKNKYNPENKYPVVGVISRYFELKGIQYIIPAFEKLLQTHPNALLVLANASGNYANEIKRLLYNLPPGSYREISFEPDLFALYQIFDVFLHVPVDPSIEAFGQTYVEALAAGIPSVFTLSGVAREFISDKQNALVAEFRESESIYTALLEIFKNDFLTQKLIYQGKKDVYHRFTLQKMLNGLTNLYAS